MASTIFWILKHTVTVGNIQKGRSNSKQTVSMATVYTKYKKYCSQQGIEPVNCNNFQEICYKLLGIDDAQNHKPRMSLVDHSSDYVINLTLNAANFLKEYLNGCSVSYNDQNTEISVISEAKLHGCRQIFNVTLYHSGLISLSIDNTQIDIEKYGFLKQRKWTQSYLMTFCNFLRHLRFCQGRELLGDVVIGNDIMLGFDSGCRMARHRDCARVLPLLSYNTLCDNCAEGLEDVSNRHPDMKANVPDLFDSVSICLPVDLLHHCTQPSARYNSSPGNITAKFGDIPVNIDISHEDSTIRVNLKADQALPLSITEGCLNYFIDSVKFPDVSDNTSPHKGLKRKRLKAIKSHNALEEFKSDEAPVEHDLTDESLKNDATIKEFPVLDLIKSMRNAMEKDIENDSMYTTEVDTVLPKLGILQRGKVSKWNLNCEEGDDKSVCQICGLTFKRILGLMRHTLKKHGIKWADYSTEYVTNDSEFTADDDAKVETTVLKFCPVCKESLHHNSYIVPHVRLRHKDYKDLKSLERLLLPNMIPNLPLLEPDMISKESSNTDSCTDDSNISCPECLLIYMEPKTILKHVRQVHKDSPKFKQILSDVEEKIYASRTQERHSGIIGKCDICNAERQGRSIIRHLELCHKGCQNYDEIYKKAMLVYTKKLQELRRKKKRTYESKLRSSGVIYPCRYCSRSFKHRPARSNHENFRCPGNLKKRKLFDCGKCGFTTGKEEVYVEHIEKHKLVPPVNNCDLCDKSYQSRAGLIIHKRKVHKVFAKRPIVDHKCDICDKTFYDQHRLDKHRVSHSKERPYQCELCGEQYKTQVAIAKHQRMVHENRYKYHCDKCGHGVEKARYLNKHVCGRVRRVQDQEKVPYRVYTMPRKPKKNVRMADPPNSSLTKPSTSKSANLQGIQTLNDNAHFLSSLNSGDANLSMQDIVESIMNSNVLSDSSLTNYTLHCPSEQTESIENSMSNSETPGSLPPIVVLSQTDHDNRSMGRITYLLQGQDHTDNNSLRDDSQLTAQIQILLDSAQQGSTQQLQQFQNHLSNMHVLEQPANLIKTSPPKHLLKSPTSFKMSAQAKKSKEFMETTNSEDMISLPIEYLQILNIPGGLWSNNLRDETILSKDSESTETASSHMNLSRQITSPSMSLSGRQRQPATKSPKSGNLMNQTAENAMNNAFDTFLCNLLPTSVSDIEIQRVTPANSPADFPNTTLLGSVIDQVLTPTVLQSHVDFPKLLQFNDE